MDTDVVGLTGVSTNGTVELDRRILHQEPEIGDIKEMLTVMTQKQGQSTLSGHIEGTFEFQDLYIRKRER